ncbi:lysozyme inhibitor LprI family protein [Algoriphagus sp. PAP.12]|uniref:lysozyme inhibitor LprI family protein n=1 Tax=Algoriphagus sp. PAP.12 TaxID=2996678 RepID=UPI00227D2C0E|nr:lysozyme inhibitor LprI family protein [Algoriphagus sp. PAP.12]
MKKTSLLFLLFTISSLAFSQTEGSETHSIGLKRTKCLSLETNFTTSGMVNCEITARQEWDKEMNKYYQLLMSLLDSAGKEKLKIAQRQWIEFRDKEFEIINELYLGQM